MRAAGFRVILALVILAAFGCARLLLRSADPSSPHGQFESAQQLLNEQRYPEAISLFHKVIQEAPRSEWAARAQYGIATAYISAENPQKDFTQALAEFEEFLYRFPNDELAPDARNWRQVIKVLLETKKENERLNRNIEELKQLDMRQERKRMGR